MRFLPVKALYKVVVTTALLFCSLQNPLPALSQQHFDSYGPVALQNEGSTIPDGDRICELALEKRLWDPYWKSILHRLVGDDANAFLGVIPRVSVISGAAPNAYAGDRSQLVISSGLLEIVDTSSELAFVMAHEIGHLIIAHHGPHYLNHEDHSLALQIREELEADRLAIGMLLEGGFDPGAGRSILQKLRNYGQERGIRLEETYPSLTLRYNALDIELANLARPRIETPQA